jgi:uncharacterized membrane protein
VVWLLWFGLLWLVTLPQTDVYLHRFAGRLRRTAHVAVLVLALIAVFIAGSYIGLKSKIIHAADFPEPVSELLASLEAQPQYSDGAALTHQATENFMEGENPYAVSNVLTAMDEFEGPYIHLTPRQAGRFVEVFPYPSQEQLLELWNESALTPDTIPVELESRLNYPAGSFLLTAPFMLAGIDTLQVILAIFLIATAGYALWRIPSGNKLIFALALVVSTEIWVSGIIGLDKRVIILPFMMMGWILIPEKPKTAMALIGVAAAAYQTAWFLLPFSIIYVYHRWGWGQAFKGAAIAAGVFIGFNLPFIFADPGLWLSSVLAPMVDELYPMGVGLVSLVETGIFHIGSSTLFTILEAAAFAGGLLWYFQHGRGLAETGLLLSILPMFFAWRSLGNYFFYVDLIILAALLITVKTGRRLQPAAV